MRELCLLVLAAVLEIGGDSLIRYGLRGRGVTLMAAGAIALVGYGFMVNVTRLDFGRLMGLYIVLFFVLSQIVAVVIFKERLTAPIALGGGLIIAGGVLMLCWRTA